MPFHAVATRGVQRSRLPQDLLVNFRGDLLQRLMAKTRAKLLERLQLHRVAEQLKMREPFFDEPLFGLVGLAHEEFSRR